MHRARMADVARCRARAMRNRQCHPEQRCSGWRVTPSRPTIMPDIPQDFPNAAPAARVYEAVSAPAILDEWWTIRSTGRAEVGAAYTLDFGPDYVWTAEVTRAEPG